MLEGLEVWVAVGVVVEDLERDFVDTEALFWGRYLPTRFSGS